MFKSDFYKALEDYKKARRSAAVQELLARLSGSPEEAALLSYDDVRQQLRAVQKSAERLAEIPLDAIVGSVGRYHDFTRKFLPKKSISGERWARVMATSQGLAGLQAIEVYQIGEAFFVKDGNHRVSVARQMGNSTIQAYITEVETKVALPPDITPDELIIKGEQVNFLEKTRLDQSLPDADLTATKPGAYPTLLEHIAVHRYYMGLEQQREIPFQDAAEHWYRSVFQPVLDIILQRYLLRDFPGRTATDMYLWAADHRAALADQVGWDIGPEAALSDLSEKHSRYHRRTFPRFIKQVVNALIPDLLESGPPPGTWREKLTSMTVLESLFSNLILALDDSRNAWNALDMAILVARAENSRIHGIHIHEHFTGSSNQVHDQFRIDFENKCRAGGVPDFDFMLTEGEIWKILTEQSRYADLVILPLNHPPEDTPLERLSSGITTLIRSCPVPVLTVPVRPFSLRTIVLAYDGSLKAREALFISAYLGTQLGSSLRVLTSREGTTRADSIQAEVKTYLEDFPLKAEYILTDENVSSAISTLARQETIDLVLIGGYGGSSLLPVMLGSVVDQVLREIQLPILIAR
jgi:nucleotide-binding universal stress UspA family protein